VTKRERRDLFLGASNRLGTAEWSVCRDDGKRTVPLVGANFYPETTIFEGIQQCTEQAERLG
jgi:hypothetical protein